MINTEKISNSSSNNDEINLKPLINKIIRNKLLILTLTSFSTIISISYSLITQPIYKGGFQIVVESKDDNDFNNSLLKLSSFDKGKNKTEEFILNSPSVLKPVYSFAKNHYLERGEKRMANLSYNKWNNTKLGIAFEKGTNVLSISFIDKDKDFIIDVLNLISSKYQSYSKAKKEKELTNTITFLSEQQIIIAEKQKKSLKELNKFSIENGLGDIDGFVSLENNTSGVNFLKLDENANSNEEITNLITKNQEQLIGKKRVRKNKAGQRFEAQFQLLESLEAEYLIYKSTLKPESEFLRNLKSKIDQLKESLKRPNEILVKYKELLKISDRDESLLSQIENELIVTKLDLSRQRDPWDLISQPTIDDARIWPLRKQIVISTFLISILLALTICYLKEYYSGIIYDLEQLKRFIKCKYLDTLYIKNNFISEQLIQKIIISNTKSKNKNNIAFVNINSKNNDLVESLISNILNKDNKIINLDEKPQLNNYEEIVFIVFENNIHKKEIMLMNKYATLYEEKLVGWFLINADYEF